MTGSRRRSFAFVILIAVLLSAGRGILSAQVPDSVSYTVRFPAPATHYAEVEAVVPADGRATIELMMAAWTPGSYLIREYARHVEAVRAATPAEEPLAVAKSSKNRWRIETGGADRVTVTYRIYCREMSVRTNWVEAGFAMLNGAPTFLTPADAAPRPHDVRIELPPGWTESVTALPAAPEGRPHSYRAADFDTLVDSPIVAGNPATYAFTVEGTPHALVNMGEGGVWDGPTSAADVERIVREQHRTWGFFPYGHYLFLNMLVEAGGGLEHKDSTLLMTSRWTTRDRRRYLRWLGTVSHELFHAWNVKQLRPAALGPFDYEREAFTPSLWMVEGLTSYYGPLAVHRAGISTRKEFLDALSGQIEALQTTPGRLVQPVADASYDAWITRGRRSTTAATRTVRTPRSATTRREPSSGSCSMPACRRRPAAGGAWTTCSRPPTPATPTSTGSGPASSKPWRPRSPASISAAGSTGPSARRTSSTTRRLSPGTASSSPPTAGPTRMRRRRPGSASERASTAGGCSSPASVVARRATRRDSTWGMRSSRSATTVSDPRRGDSGSISIGRETQSPSS